jgi:hypothetical protein
MRGYSTGKRLAFKQAMFIIISFAQKMCRSDLKTMTLAVRLTVLYACLEVALDMASPDQMTLAYQDDSVSEGISIWHHEI